MGKAVSRDVMQWKPAAEKYGNEYGVDPYVILAIINEESSGNPASAGPNGVKGLMQIAPDTWTECIEDLQMPNADVLNGDDNIHAGVYYLSVLKQANGTFDKALQRFGGYTKGDNDPDWIAYKTEIYEAAEGLSTGKVNWEGSGGSSASSIASKDPRGILQFAQFAESMAFTKQMVEGFEQGMEYTLHQYLTHFMSKFYHTMYYVPTLPSNKAIIVKPETMFIDPPSCNVLYPTMKMSLGFARNPKSEPTRILMISDPVSNVFGVSGGQVSQLVTMAFLDENADGTQKVVGVSNLTDKKYPMRNLTAFEKKNGIRILRTNQGEDLYLFLVSGQKTKSVSAGNKSVNATVITSASNPTGIAQTLFELANYSLLRTRYESRGGSAATYFNPYIVPGFPMLSVEEGRSSMNVYAYVTDVTHQLSSSECSTQVGFTATHIENEPRPPAFPIIEQDYVKFIDSTYTQMLGTAVTRIDGTTGAEKCRTEYKATDGTVSSTLKKIWRPLTTMEEHLSTVCDGATVVQDKGYRWFQNGDKSKFFDPATQVILKSYTENILDGVAFTESDVR